MLKEVTQTRITGDVTSNRGTLVASCGGQPAAVAPAPEPAFHLAYARLRALHVTVDGPGFAVAAVTATGRVEGAEFIAVGAAATVGRHSQCRLRLHPATVALRAIAMLVVRDRALDRLELRVWDLATGQPFLTEDGLPAAALASDGPTYLAIGAHALWFLPVAPGSQPPATALEAWAALPERRFLDRRLPTVRPRTVPAWPGAAPIPGGISCEQSPDHRSHVTRVAPPLYLGEEDAPELGWAELRIESRSRPVCRAVSAEQLERGLLVGRYERCRLQLPDDDHVSRVHLLLVRIGSDVWAIDTASTNGVRAGGHLIEAGIVADRATLDLSEETRLEWSRTQRELA